MLQALANVQAMLCVVPGRLERTEGERREMSIAGVRGSKSEEGGEPQICAKLAASVDQFEFSFVRGETGVASELYAFRCK